MRIALMGTKYSPPNIRGGEDAVIHALKRELERRGHHVTVFVIGWRRFRSADLASPEPHVIRFKVPSIRYFYHFSYVGQLSRILENTHFDLFINTHSHLGLRLNREPHIVIAATTSKGEARSMSVNSPVKVLEWLLRKTLACWIEKSVFRRCTNVVAVGPHIKEEVLEHYSTRPEKVAVIGNGVDVERFCPGDSIPREVPVIFSACRLVARKNVSLMIESAALLKKNGVSFAMRIAGEGDERTRLDDLVKKFKIEDCVVFLGRIDTDQMLEEYQRSDVFVLPSRYEGMPMALLESQACGVPAVVAPFRGVEDILLDGKSGVVLKRDCPEHLADELAGLLVNRRRRVEMGEQARANMETNFSWASIVDQYLKLVGMRERY